MLVGIGKDKEARGISAQKFRLSVNRHVRSLSENIIEHLLLLLLLVIIIIKVTIQFEYAIRRVQVNQDGLKQNGMLMMLIYWKEV